jgi:hypothetical protein
MTTGTNVKHGLSLPIIDDLWSLPTLRMQEKIVPRAMFVPKRMEITGDS